MNELKQALKGQQLVSAEVRTTGEVHPVNRNEQKIQGVLTSRIETKDKENKPYYYGFFKIKDQNQEIPVI